MNKKATFGGGCFWGVEESFRKLDGVLSTRVGYMGGKTNNPTYEEVCNKDTGHAEVVEVTYDENKISYEELLKKFFEIHDPTQLNRQGPDIGDQYRSVIFFHNNEQESTSKEVISLLEKESLYKDPIVTKVVEAPEFWEAEDYHQKYIFKKGGGVCH
jgi:peptide-methionine (S)-S-oxide reductase